MRIFVALGLTLLFGTGCISVMQNDGSFEHAAEQARCLEDAERPECRKTADVPYYLDNTQVESSTVPDLNLDATENNSSIHSDVI